MITLSEVDIAWLAGILEGEGSFVAGPPSDPALPRISLQMADEEIVARVAKLFGISYATLTKRKNWKVCYALVLSGSKAVIFMKMIYRFMGSRRKNQIDNAIANYKPKPHSKNLEQLAALGFTV